MRWRQPGVRCVASSPSESLVDKCTDTSGREVGRREVVVIAAPGLRVEDLMLFDEEALLGWLAWGVRVCVRVCVCVCGRVVGEGGCCNDPLATSRTADSGQMATRLLAPCVAKGHRA